MEKPYLCCLIKTNNDFSFQSWSSSTCTVLKDLASDQLVLAFMLFEILSESQCQPCTFRDANLDQLLMFFDILLETSAIFILFEMLS